MAEWTKDDVKLIAPEFAAVDDATLDQYIAFAYTEVNPCAFGSRTVRAGALMTAHLLTVLPPAGVTPKASASGPVQSRSVGGVSVTYATVQLSGAALSSGLAMSKYGIEFARLSRISAGATVL
jgi:hypothetical protein